MFLSAGVEGQTVAFPGALGFGAYATGGRNGTVYHVTNTNDSGTGSFRDAVSSSGRTVVFDVGGTITLSSAVSVKQNITIAGQTAPGGICLNGGELAFANRTNIICRYVRVRPGSATASTGDDCLSLYMATNCILDHCSLEFGPWNNIDAVTANSISIQHCIDANPIYQQFGAHTENVNAFYSWTYNIFANSHNRNPLAKINTVFINNVDYNCSAGYTTHTSTSFKHDIVNNYFVAGPAYSTSGDFPWYQVDKNQSIYYSGNLADLNEDGTLNGAATTPYWYQGTGTVLSSPWSSWTTVIPTVSADLAWRYDVSTAGAFPRDPVDALVISQVQTLGNGTTGYTNGTTGPNSGLYTSQAQTGLDNNGYGTLTGGTAPTNSSGDGIADYWKLANNLNTNFAYALTNTSDGYTLLEHYLNFLAAPHAVTQTNTPVDINLSQLASGFAASAIFSLTNATNGTVTLLNNTNAHFIPAANFTGLGTFTFAVTENSYTLCAAVTICATPVAPPASATHFNGAMVQVVTNASTTVTPPSNLTWRGDGATNLWNTSVSNWLNGASTAAFKNGDAVTFDDSGSTSPAVTLSGTVSPGAVLFNNTQNYTLSGSGALSGSGSLTKSGTGLATIGTTNSSYTGSINVNTGMLALVSSASLGSGPITLNDGATFYVLGGGSGSTVSGAFNVPAGNSVVVGSGQLATGFAGAMTSGDTNSTITLSNSVSFTSSSSSQFSGFTGTVNIPSGSTLRFSYNGSGASLGSLNPNFIINGTLQPRNAGNTITLGALNGAGSLTGPQTTNTGTASTIYNIGGKNLNATFTGNIVSNMNSFGSLICVNKLGTGTQTLSGNNTFGGTNGILAGTLLVNGTNMPYLTTVFANATLGGTGVINGTVRVNSGGILAPGAGGPGTLTLNGALTNNSPILDFDLSGSPSGANDQINMTGTLAMSGVQMFHFNLINGTLGAGTYGLIEGATSSTASSVTLSNNLPASTRQTFTMSQPAAGSNPSYIRLVVSGTASSLVWSGTNGNAWDVASTANWNNAGSADVFYNLDQVTFNDTSTNGGVAIGGIVQPATLLVSNNATSFTFSNGVIGGMTSLVKTGSGALTLAASNAYTGGTWISGGGTLQVNNAYALGSGAAALAGSALHFSSVGAGNAINASGTSTLQFSAQTANIYTSFALSGSGWLNLGIDGNDVFTPSGDWSGFSGYIYFTGSKWLRAFSASIGSANAVWDLGSGGGIYNRDGGYTVYLGALFGGSGSILSGASTANVNPTTYVVGSLNTNCTFNGTLADNASPTALVKTGSAQLTLTGASTFTGGTTVNAGTLCVNSTAGSGTGTGDLEVFSGATLTGSGIIGSATTIDGGAMLAPGNPTGTLTFTNNLTLNDSSLLQFDLGTNRDAIAVSGDLALTGQLTVTNSGGFGPGSYPLFTYGGSLNFGNLVLASAPSGYNYSFDTNTAGIVKLAVTLPTGPLLSSSVTGDGKFAVSGSGGIPGATYYVVTSTNLAAPLANWARLATNQFDASGNFAITNGPATNAQIFFRVQVP